jgi:hypothetical protein
MATNVDEGNRPEPGMGLALLSVLVIILTMALLSGLIWALMVGITATSSSSGESGTPPAAQSQPSIIDQRAAPAAPSQPGILDQKAAPKR